MAPLLITEEPQMSQKIPLEYSLLAYLRIWQIIGDPKANPPVPPLIPVSRSTWLKRVKNGDYPQPYKISPRCVAWRVRDIIALLENMGA